jgi:outer membrane receptor protein involved in Fe transport
VFISDASSDLDLKALTNYMMTIDVNKKQAYSFYFHTNDPDHNLTASFSYVSMHSAKYNTTGMGGLLLHPSLLDDIIVNQYDFSKGYINHIILAKLTQLGFQSVQVPISVNKARYDFLAEINDYKTSKALVDFYVNEQTVNIQQVDEFPLMNVLVASYMGHKNNHRYNTRLLELFKNIFQYRHKTFVIYGYNYYGILIFKELLAENLTFYCILDQKADTFNKDDSLRMFNILHPDELQLKNKYHYIIASDLHKSSMQATLNDLGVLNHDITCY